MEENHEVEKKSYGIICFFLVVIALGALIGLGTLILKYIESTFGPSMNFFH
jgi:hypothetical protein